MSACQLSKEQLIEVMQNMLKHFNLGVNDITEDTKHSDILSGESIGPTSSKELYQLFIRYTITLNGCEDKNWPDNWPDLTIVELAEELV